jgi:hypothetical protein
MIAPLFALVVVGIESSACSTAPPGSSLNIGEHHQHVSGCGRRARQHSVANQRCRRYQPATGQQKRGSLIWLLFPLKTSLQNAPERAPGCWLGS